MKYLVIWLAAAVVVAFVVGSLNIPAYHRLAEAGVQGQGTVIELLPKMHNTVRYEYHVAGQTFQGRMRSWNPNPPLQMLGVGQAVVIYYDPQRPQVSVLGDPGPMLDNELFSVGLAVILMPTFIVGVLASRAANKKAGKNASKETDC